MKSQEELKENIVALINLWFNDYNDDSDDVLSNNIIDLFDQQNAKLVEENDKYKDFYDNWFNVATDYLKLKEENKELIQTNNDFHSRINHDREFKEVLKSELTQAKERIGGLEKEIAKEKEIRIVQLAGISTAAIGYYKEGYGIHEDYDTVALRDVCALYTEYEEKFELVESLESKCKGLEEKQIGFAEWLMEKGYLPLLRKITKEKVRFRIDELYAIYSQTLLNG